MAPEFHERRRFERVDLTLPVIGECRDRVGAIHPFQGQTQNVSFEGFCLRVESTNGYKVGQSVIFRTSLYGGNPLIRGHGRVCWVKTQPTPPWLFNVGVMLTTMRHYKSWHEMVKERIH